MAGDFVALKQGTVAITTGASADYIIPLIDSIKGFPAGQPLVIKVVADTKAVFKLGTPADRASKTITSNNLVDGNIYAYRGAIETYKVVSTSSLATPTHIHAIATDADGNIDYAFGYYI